EAIWALMAPVIILGSMRTGLVTPTEAAALAVLYGVLVGVFVYRTINFRTLYGALVDACETSAVILVIMAMAAVFGVASNALGTFESMAQAMVATVSSELLMLLMINIMLLF